MVREGNFQNRYNIKADATAVDAGGTPAYWLWYPKIEHSLFK